MTEQIKPLIRLYRPGDEEQIVKLLIDVFGQWPRFDIPCSAVEHWKWKFIDNPANKEIYPHTVAEIGGEIVGVTHGMMFYNKIGQGRYYCEKAVDVAVSSKHRGLGIFTKINSYKNEVLRKQGQDFDYSLTINPILVNRTRRNVEPELKFPQPLKYLVKIDNIDMYFKNYVKKKDSMKKDLLKTAVYGSKTINKIATIGVKAPQLKGVSFKEITRFDESIEKFYEKIKPHYNFVVEKTMRHLNWRYCDKRGGDFKVWIAEENSEIVGFLVLRINKIDPGHPVGFIMDLLSLNGRDDVAENFIEMAIDYFDEHGVGVVYAQVIGGHPYEVLFGRYGLLDSRAKPYLVYRAINLGDDLERFVKSPASMLHYPYGEGDAI